jgi:SAM-dependent methyltransferase
MGLVANPGGQGVICVLCGGREFRLRHQWDVGDYWNQANTPIAVWDCTACKLVMLYPVPRSVGVRDTDLGEVQSLNVPTLPDWNSPQRKNLARHYRWKYFRKRVMESVRGTRSDRFLAGCLKVQGSGKLLDVGAGFGDFLLRASDFYECTAVEPSPPGAAACRARGFDVYEDTFEQAELPEDYFGMITMDSVIEHFNDPVAVLAKCARILRPGGCVGIITPNLAGPSYAWHRAGWNGFRHGWHTFLFTGKTLKQCMRRAGLEVVRWPQRNWPLLDDGLILWGRKPLAAVGKRTWATS